MSAPAAAEVTAEKPQEDGVAAPDARMSTADSVAPAHLPVAADHALPATESDAAEAFMRITAPDEPPPAPSQRALSEEAAHSECPDRAQSDAATDQHNQRCCKRALHRLQHLYSITCTVKHECYTDHIVMLPQRCWKSCGKPLRPERLHW